MSRVAIDLDDYWTQRRTTRIRWTPPFFSGCGISLDVWQHLFDFRDGSWLACVHGGYHDNLTLVSVDGARIDDAAAPFKLSPEAVETANVSRLAETFGVRVLDERGMRSLGHAKPEDLRVDDRVRACVELHDNFMFTLERRAPALEVDALRLVLRVQQHYLDRDLPDAIEERLLQEIRAVLLRETSLDLAAEPAARRLRVSYDRPKGGWLNRVLGRRERIDTLLRVDD